MKKNTSVDEYIKKHSEWKELLLALRKIMQNSELEETIKWGAPVYTILGKNVVGISAFKSYAGLWFFNGAQLKDTLGKLINAQEGKTKAMRQWRFSQSSELDQALVETYVKEAIELQKAGKVVPIAKPDNKITIPEELQAILGQNKALSAQFQSFTPYKQKEFVEYIGSAKREATRLSRLEKCIDLIDKGIGLNDKYRN